MDGSTPLQEEEELVLPSCTSSGEQLAAHSDSSQVAAGDVVYSSLPPDINAESLQKATRSPHGGESLLVRKVNGKYRITAVSTPGQPSEVSMYDCTLSNICVVCMRTIEKREMFINFPDDLDRRRIWGKLLGFRYSDMLRLKFQSSVSLSNGVICTDHFSEECLRMFNFNKAAIEAFGVPVAVSSEIKTTPSKKRTPWECTICDYKSLSVLKTQQHMLGHTETTSTKEQLLHRERGYSCPFCRKCTYGYKTLSGFKRHLVSLPESHCHLRRIFEIAKENCRTSYLEPVQDWQSWTERNVYIAYHGCEPPSPRQTPAKLVSPITKPLKIVRAVEESNRAPSPLQQDSGIESSSSQKSAASDSHVTNDSLDNQSVEMLSTELTGIEDVVAEEVTIEHCAEQEDNECFTRSETNLSKDVSEPPLQRRRMESDQSDSCDVPPPQLQPISPRSTGNRKLAVGQGTRRWASSGQEQFLSEASRYVRSDAAGFRAEKSRPLLTGGRPTVKLTSSSPPLRGGQSANSVFPIKRLIRTDMVGLPVHIPIPPSPVSNSSTGQRVYVKPSSSTMIRSVPSSPLKRAHTSEPMTQPFHRNFSGPAQRVPSQASQQKPTASSSAVNGGATLFDALTTNTEDDFESIMEEDFKQPLFNWAREEKRKTQRQLEAMEARLRLFGDTSYVEVPEGYLLIETSQGPKIVEKSMVEPVETPVKFNVRFGTRRKLELD